MRSGLKIRVFGPGGEEINPARVNWSAVNASNWNAGYDGIPVRGTPWPDQVHVPRSRYDICRHALAGLIRRQVRAFSLRWWKNPSSWRCPSPVAEPQGRTQIERLVAGANRPILLQDPDSPYRLPAAGSARRRHAVQGRPLQPGPVRPWWRRCPVRGSSRSGKFVNLL